jgi:multidrug resistance efflux pump
MIKSVISKIKPAAATLVLASVVAFGLSACGGAPTEATAPETAAQVAPAQQATPEAQPQPTEGGTVLSQPGELVFGVSATGQVEANQDAALVFQVNGSVGQVLVEEGATVKQGDVLAVLDVRQLDQDVRDAEARLVSARADQQALTEDPTPEELAAQEANLNAARGQLAQQQGAVTQADIEAARAALVQAEANLADVLAGPKQEEVRQATANRDAAALQLSSTREETSYQKTQAEIALQQTTIALQQAQVEYSEAYWDWKYAQDRGAQASDFEQGAEPSLSDSGTQAIYNRFKQAELALANSERTVESAQKNFELAQKAEIAGIAVAEKNLEAAQATLDLLLRPADADNVALAESQVATARANLEKLTGGQRAGQLAAAEAQVAAAQANLDRLYSDPTASAAAKAEAQVVQAEASLERAKLNREYAEIRAPFDGEVAAINIDPGDTAPVNTAGGEAAIRLVDTSELYVEIEVSDADIAQVEVGQKADLFADALPGEQFTGTVSFVSPAATVQGNVTTYKVKIKLDDNDGGLRIGMAVTADLQTEE